MLNTEEIKCDCWHSPSS